jgi:predicted metal-dependent enzyme (double-stranded beta helix superfamily)
MSRPASRLRVPVNLAEQASALAAQRSLWEPLIAYDALSRYYVRLSRETHFEAWLLTWLPGQGTDWHDHGGSAGAFQVLRGVLTEDQARAAEPGRATVERSQQLMTGGLRTFGRRYIHRVRNDHMEPAVSVHVYSPALLAMNQYAAEGAQLRLAASRSIGVHW